MSASDNYLVRCGQCGAKNRIPAARINQRPKCGKCGVKLDVTGLFSQGPVAVTDQNFDSTVLHAPIPVLLDCWAAWCGPCKSLSPVIDQLARDWSGRIRVGKLNIDQNQHIANRFQVMSVPTLLVFDRGQLKDRMVGALPKTEILRHMHPYLQA